MHCVAVAVAIAVAVAVAIAVAVAVVLGLHKASLFACPHPALGGLGS